MPDIKSQIESILFAASRPVKLSELIKALGAAKDDVKAALADIKAAYETSGINLIEKDDRWQLITNPANGKVVGNFMNAEVREKLTDAALETLAIILYKQPITRAEIEAIRGVNSQYILRQLLIRGLIEKALSPEDARRNVYKTTLDFMAHLGITDMKTLPDFEELTKSVEVPMPAAVPDATPANPEINPEQEQEIPPAAVEPEKPVAGDTKNPEEPEEFDEDDEDDEDDEE